MQDRFGHRQADQRLLKHWQTPFMGQGDQLRLKLLAVATEYQPRALVGEQRMTQVYFQLCQAFT